MARCQEIEDDEKFKALSEIELTVRLKAIELSYKQLRTRHLRVAGVAEDHDDRRDAAGWLLPIENIYLKVTAKIEAELRQIGTAKEPTGAVQATAAAVSAGGSLVRVETVRQPEIGEFDGSPAAWPAFRDLFQAEVHERELNDVTKLLYLQKACVGRARAALGTWRPLATNYASAWQTLERKYDDSYRIKQALISELFQISQCTEETFDGLRKIIDVATSVLRQLECMGEPTEQWDMIMIHVLSARIPYKTLDAWEQRRSVDEEPTLDKFLEFLEGKARGKIGTAQPQSGRDHKHDYRPNDNKRHRPNEHTGYRQNDNKGYRSSVTNGYKSNDISGRRLNYDNGYKPTNSENYKRNNSDNHKQGNGDYQPMRSDGGMVKEVRRNDGARNTQRPACRQCNGEHALFRCPMLLAKTVEQRIQIIAKEGLCANCLRAHTGECFYSGCPRCGGEKHNSILCKKVPPAPTMRSQVNLTKTKSNKRKHTE